MSTPFQLELSRFLTWCLNDRPGEVEGISWVVKGFANANDKRPAYVETLVPNDWVKNIRGYDALRDTYMSFRIPKELVQEWKAMRSAPAGLQDALEGAKLEKEGESEGTVGIGSR